jgi:hypothetical protein
MVQAVFGKFDSVFQNCIPFEKYAKPMEAKMFAFFDAKLHVT